MSVGFIDPTGWPPARPCHVLGNDHLGPGLNLYIPSLAAPGRGVLEGGPMPIAGAVASAASEGACPSCRSTYHLIAPQYGWTIGADGKCTGCR